MSLQLASPAQAAASTGLSAPLKASTTAEGALRMVQPILDVAAAADLTAPLLSVADAEPVATQLLPWWPAVPPAGRRIEAVAGAAVGEPGTYALLAMGLLAVGAALFRQRPWRLAQGRAGSRIR